MEEPDLDTDAIWSEEYPEEFPILQPEEDDEEEDEFPERKKYWFTRHATTIKNLCGLRE